MYKTLLIVVLVVFVFTSVALASIDDHLAKLKDAYLAGDMNEFKNQLLMLYTIYIGHGEKRLIEAEITDQPLVYRSAFSNVAIPIGYGFYALNAKFATTDEARLDCEILNKSHYPDTIVIVTVSFYDKNDNLLGVWSRDLFFDYGDNLQSISATRQDIEAKNVYSAKIEISSVLRN